MLDPRRIVTVLLLAALSAMAIAGCGSSSHPPTKAGLAAVWGMPSDGHPRGLMLLIHGGGWKGNDTIQFRNTVAGARNYQRLGYETLTFDYRGGAQSIQDAEMFYRVARKRVGPNFPICAVGTSAGGHIALMLAERNPDLACVLDLAGPTDLAALPNEPQGAYAYSVAIQQFGKAHLAAYSPALHASSIRAKVLLAYAQGDPAVPLAQGEAMARALPSARLIVLPRGPAMFVHSGVSVAARQQSLAAIEAFLAHATSSWRRPSPST